MVALLRKLSWGVAVASLIAGVLLVLPRVYAANPPSDFSLQVTPSPLVATVKPGQTTQLELKVRNAGSGAEDLKIEPHSFAFDSNSEQVKLDDATPSEVAKWISFSAPTFTVQPGQWFSEKISLSVPKEAGFSYSFALLISRQKNPQPIKSGRLLTGSVAVFTLLNVDRPGATRKLEVSKFVTDKGFYEYLPAQLSVQFKNTGNSIVQPTGNVFIQRHSNDALPMSTLPVNGQYAYILPGTERTAKTTWADAFPVYKTVIQADGSTKRQLTWNWADLSQLRIGRYTAKLVAVYNDGHRDVPIQGEVSFWVIPWRLLLGVTLVVLLLLAGLWTITRKVVQMLRRKHKPTKHHFES